MAKAKPTKGKTKKKAPTTYEQKLVVTGSFLDIMKAAGKDANKKSEPKKP